MKRDLVGLSGIAGNFRYSRVQAAASIAFIALSLVCLVPESRFGLGRRASASSAQVQADNAGGKLYRSTSFSKTEPLPAETLAEKQEPVIAKAGGAIGSTWLGEWVVDVLDRRPGIGEATDAKIDQAGGIHLSYQDQVGHELMYAFIDESGLEREVIDRTGTPGYSLRMTLDNAGQPHIFHADMLNRQVRQVARDRNGWSSEVCLPTFAAPTADDRRFLAAAMDGNRPVLAYTDYGSTGATLALAINDGQGWESFTVDDDPGAGWYPSLVILDDHRPALAAWNTARDLVSWTFPEPGFWYRKTISMGFICGWVCMARTPSNYAHACFQQGWQLHYARQTGDRTWQTEIIDESLGSGNAAYLAVSRDEQPGIAYLNGDLTKLVFAQQSDGEWQRAEVFQALTSIQGCSFAFDAIGRPWIFFVADHQLMYATRVNPFNAVMIALNQKHFRAHDPFVLSVKIDAIQGVLDADLLLALEYHGQFRFFPSWSEEVTPQSVMLLGARRHVLELLQFDWPEGISAGGSATFWALLCTPGTHEPISNIDYAEFSFE